MALTSVTIRPIEPSDREAVLILAGSLSDWFNEEGLAQMGRDLASHAGFDAVHRDRSVGFATWRLVEGDTADFSWMGVAREYHRKGLGRALVRTLSAQLRARGIRFLDVSTVADSVSYAPYIGTRAFYRALGFRDHRVDRGFYGQGDDRYDRLILRLDLSCDEGGPA